MSFFKGKIERNRKLYLFGPEKHDISQNNHSRRIIEHLRNLNGLIVIRTILGADPNELRNVYATLRCLPQPRFHQLHLRHLQQLPHVLDAHSFLHSTGLLRRRRSQPLQPYSAPGNVHRPQLLDEVVSGDLGGPELRLEPGSLVKEPPEESILSGIRSNVRLGGPL